MDELQTLLEFEQNDRWLHENIDRLRDKFANKFVAVKNKKVIVYSAEIDDLIKKLEKKKEKPNEVLIEFINTKDFKLLL